MNPPVDVHTVLCVLAYLICYPGSQLSEVATAHGLLPAQVREILYELEHTHAWGVGYSSALGYSSLDPDPRLWVRLPKPGPEDGAGAPARPLEQILQGAFYIAREAPRQRSAYVSHARVPWREVERIRTNLQALGINPTHWDAKGELERLTRSAREGAL